MGNLKHEFVSKDKRKFRFALGSAVASAFSGFLAGLAVAGIIFLSFFDLTLKS